MGNIQQKKQSAKGVKKIRKQIKQQTLSYVAAGLGLVAGLAWNEAIRAFIEYLFPIQRNTLLVKFLYAFLITAAVVAITMYLTRLFKDKEEE